MKPVFTKIRSAGLMVLLLFMAAKSYAVSYDKVVAKDGGGDYTTVQAAIDAAPTGLTAPYRIYIKNGTYKEVVEVPSNKPFIQLIGESVASTIITYDNYSGKPMPGGGNYSTSTSATVTIKATDFSAVNITFENTTGDAPQALAINVNNDRCSFKNCRFLGGQDTLLANNNGMRQYYLNCYIDGVVDFIFGNARAVFDHCIIYPKDRKDNLANSYITAANTKSPEPYGFVFRDCEITANTGVTKYVLGRPWQNGTDFADADKSRNQTVFLNTIMGASVNPVGWAIWDAGTNTSYINYAEYNSKNPDGSALDVSQRVAWSKQLSSTEADAYSDANLFAGWDPAAVFLDGATYSAPLVVSNFAGVKGTTTTPFKWNISWPMSGVQYDVYRSTDNGLNFSIINTQTSSDANVNFSYTATNPPPGESYQYYLKATKASYADYQSDIVTISSVPTITVTGSPGDFLQGLGTPSTSQSYTVSAVDLTTDLVITPPSGYEISSDGGTNWNDSAHPITITPLSGAVNATIAARLNASVAGSYSGDIAHTSTGALTVNQTLNGTLQNSPLLASKTIINWPLTADNSAVSTIGVDATTPTFTGLVLSDGTGGTNVVSSMPAYSATYGQAFAVSAIGGNWQTGSGGPGSLNRNFYEEFTIAPVALYQLRVDTISFITAVTQTSGNFALSYSLDDFTTITDVSNGIAPDGTALTFASNGAFTGTAIALNKDDYGTISYNYKFPLNGINVEAGKTLKVRVYYRTGSSSAGRFATLRNFIVKGDATLAPVSGDYQSHQSGDWTDLNTWERYDGTTWVTPVADYPVYNNSGRTTILNGHTVTIANTLANGGGYIHLTTINKGGQLNVNSGTDLKLANDGDANTTDLLVNGDMNVSGTLGTNGTCAIEVGGKLVNSGSISLNGTDVFTVNSSGIYQHNANTPNAPNAIWKEGSTFLITGIVSSQTGIFKSSINYYNIIWDNQNEQNGKYYAFRGNLSASNVLGKFIVKSTGATFITFNNADVTVGFPGGYEQTGGQVSVRENSTVNSATFNIGKDFVVTGGTFESNSASSVTINLTGANGTYNYNDATNTLTNLTVGVSGNYTLQSPLNVDALALSGSGKITLGSNTLTASTVTGGTSSSYIVTNGTGKLKIKNVGASNIVFPIGTSATSYSPVTINNAGTADNFAVSVQNTFAVALPTPSKAVAKQWNITEDVDGGSNATVGLGWLTADQGAGFNPAGSVSLLSYNGTNWAETGASISGDGTSGTPYTAATSGVTAFGTFGVGNPEALPLQLLSFNAKLLKNISPTVQLDWVTTNEINTSKFEIERSVDGQNFQSLGTVASKNTAGIHNYSFSDENPLAGKAYYRLKQIDLNGAFTYSKPQVVNNQGNISLNIYPNPVADVLTVDHATADQQAFIKILSLDGRVIQNIKVETGSVKTSINLSGLINGVYLLSFNSGSNNSVLKFVKL